MPSLTESPPAKKSRETTPPPPVPQEPHVHKQPVQQDAQTQTERCTVECLHHDMQQLVPLGTQQLVEKFNEHLGIMAQNLNISKSNYVSAATLSPTRAMLSNGDESKDSASYSNPDLDDSVQCISGQSRLSERHQATTSKEHRGSARREQRSLSAEQAHYSSGKQRSSSPGLSDALSTLCPCVCCSRPAVFVCSKCRLVWYCSTDCQVSTHPQLCTKLISALQVRKTEHRVLMCILS